MNKLITARKGYRKPVKQLVNLFANGSIVDKYAGLLNDKNGKYGLGKLADIANTTWNDTKGILNYLNSTNAFGLSKANNPFSKVNLAAGAKGMLSTGIGKGVLGAATGLIGSAAFNGLSGGLSSGVGNAIGNIGGTIGGAISAVNPIVGGIVSVGSNLIGGLANRAFGSKLNELKIGEIKLNTANLMNSQYSSTSGRSLLDSYNAGPKALSFSQSDVGSDGWFSNKARDKYRELKRQAEYALKQLIGNLNLAAGNLNLNLVMNQLYNIGALGGLFDVIDPSTAIGLALYTDMQINDKIKANSKNMTNIFAGTPRGIFAFGGNVQSNGAMWSDKLTHINKGGSHEESPYDGVLVGVDSKNVPNLVEEGEVIYDDYVFSNRLKVPEIKGSKDLSYEDKVLKKYSGMTYANAAKKAEKDSGVKDRPEDSIAKRGFEATLSILAASQEKEREKDKLREMQEAIDNMTPEEFAMLQQLMQASQEAQAQQEAMAKLQLMIPQGMEQMLQPMEEQQPIAALGGLLNTPDNMYRYGGDLKKFREDLKNANVSEEDYLRAFYSMTYDKLYEEAQDKDNVLSKEEYVAESLENFKLSPEKVFNDENFDKDFAETFLNRVETITKQYNRRAKKQGIKVDNLLGATKAQYNRDLNRAILKGLIDVDYDVALDTELTFNNSNVSKAKDKQEAYNNAATYNDLIARGGRAVELDDLGRPTWESIAGLNRIDNSDDNFYTNLGDLNSTALDDRGIYDYNAAQKSSIDVDDYKNVKLRGWNKNEDGTYTVSSEYDNPNQTSLNPGNSNTTYPIADIGDLKSGSEEYDAALKAIQDNADYKRQTEYVKKALEAANGDVNKLKESNPDVYNYIKYLDENSGNLKGKLLNEDGSLSKTAVKDYTRRREDSQYGIYHYLFDDAKNATANRYYHKDKDKDGKDVNVYISKPEGTDFTISENPTVVTGTDGTLFNDYEVTGLNKNRTLTLLPTGEVVDVTNINDKNNWKKLDKPVLTDNTDNLGYGIKGTTDWVDYGSSPAGKGMVTDNEPFPKMPSWPYLVGAGLQLASLGHNLLSPIDYSNADALINAGIEAGKYQPVDFLPIGERLKYNPFDINYVANQMRASEQANARALANASNGNVGALMAGLSNNNYKNQLTLANAYAQQFNFNNTHRKETAEFNKDVDKFNSEGFLKADMANQDAANRARAMLLEGLKSGYTMRQALADARSKAINAGISGLANIGLAYALNKYANDLTGWRLKTNPLAISLTEGAKGGKLKRKKKGLSF